MTRVDLRRDVSVRLQCRGERQPGLTAMIAKALMGLCLLLLVGLPQFARAEGTGSPSQGMSVTPVSSLERLDLATIRGGVITGKKRSCATSSPSTCMPGETEDKLAQYGGCVCCFVNGCGCMPINACYGQRGVCRGPC